MYEIVPYLSDGMGREYHGMFISPGKDPRLKGYSMFNVSS